jgi:hypothetical protein
VSWVQAVSVAYVRLSCGSYLSEENDQMDDIPRDLSPESLECHLS